MPSLNIAALILTPRDVLTFLRSTTKPLYVGGTGQEVGQRLSTAEEAQSTRVRTTGGPELSSRPSGDSSTTMDLSQTLGAALIDNPLAKVCKLEGGVLRS